MKVKDTETVTADQQKKQQQQHLQRLPSIRYRRHSSCDFDVVESGTVTGPVHHHHCVTSTKQNPSLERFVVIIAIETRRLI